MSEELKARLSARAIELGFHRMGVARAEPLTPEGERLAAWVAEEKHGEMKYMADTAAKHGKFRAKHGLTVELGSDADSDVIERYGAWVEKSLYGRQYMGIDRSTWLIDGDGVIRGIWRKVKVKGHATEVLAAARAL